MPEAVSAAVLKLRSTDTIRERCAKILALGRAGRLAHFAVHDDRLAACASYVVRVIRENYPTLEVPVHSRWRHFDVGGVARVASLDPALATDAIERARAQIDLAVTSVLLDAGAGAAWKFHERESGKTFARSEGLAVASFRMFEAGAFSSVVGSPLRADSAGLEGLTVARLRQGFQVSDDNPLEGVEGRAMLLRGLGRACAARPDLFGADGRPGGLVDRILANGARTITAQELLGFVLEGFSSIWPGRVTLDGQNLGDVWPHPALAGDAPGDGLVPFHKLSQWLTYSLLEPLAAAGIEVTDLSRMTGLPEYRNGGLLVDLGVISPRDTSLLVRAYAPGDEAIVEWRALTVALLDELYPLVRAEVGLSAERFPLASMLEGGTWSAGRKVAAASRPGGVPPIQIQSDGTVF